MIPEEAKAGMKATMHPLVWPPLLDLPPEDVLVVYFDLNHWIGLAQAAVGHPIQAQAAPGQYRPTQAAGRRVSPRIGTNCCQRAQ
jgi:hypothetical protein